MNFLELCEEFCALSSIPRAPTSVVGNTGELDRVARWIRQSWTDIQLKHTTWKFLMKDLSFTTTTSQGPYTLAEMGASDLQELDLNTLRCYQTSVGVSSEQFLVYWEYDIFRDTYLYANPMPASRPTVFTVDPADKSVILAPLPSSDGWTVRGKYWRKPVTLAADADIPACPDQFHMAIVHRALMKYAGYEAAQEVKQTAVEEYKTLMAALEHDQLDALQFGEPLA